MIRVLVVDDQQLIRAGITKLLGYEDDIAIVGECSDGSEVLGPWTPTSCSWTSA